MIGFKAWEITEERKSAIAAIADLKTEIYCPNCSAWLGIDDIKPYMAIFQEMLYESDTLKNDLQPINNLIELLAAGEHEQWAYWAKNILETEPGLSEGRKERWPAIIATPYKELSEDLKEIDRKEVYKRSGVVLKEIRRMYNRIAELEAELAQLC